MDNVTHALAGLLLADAAVALAERRARRPASAALRRTAAILGVLTAELPDVDLVYAGPVLGMGRLGYMLHHRGHTHTVVFAVAAALLVWGVALALGRGLRAPAERWPLLALFGWELATDLITFTDPLTDWGHPIALLTGIATWPLVRRWHRERHPLLAG